MHNTNGSNAFLRRGEKKLRLFRYRQIYYTKNVTVDNIMQDYNNDEKKFTSKYDKQYFAVVGKIENISDKENSFTIKSLNNNNSKTIECNTKDKTLIKQIGDLKNGITLKVYGQTSVSSIKKNVDLKILKIEQVKNTVYPANSYSSINGFNYDINNMSKKNYLILL